MHATMMQTACLQAASSRVATGVQLGAPSSLRQAPRTSRGRAAAGATVAQLGRDRSPPAAAGRQRRLVAHAKPGETPEQALERRMRESQQVDERVVYITNRREWDAEVAKVRSAARRPLGARQRNHTLNAPPIPWGLLQCLDSSHSFTAALT